jgi:hypothetical protein
MARPIAMMMATMPSIRSVLFVLGGLAVRGGILGDGDVAGHFGVAALRDLNRTPSTSARKRRRLAAFLLLGPRRSERSGVAHVVPDVNRAVNRQFPHGVEGQSLNLMADNGCQPTSLAFMRACAAPSSPPSTAALPTTTPATCIRRSGYERRRRSRPCISAAPLL